MHRYCIIGYKSSSLGIKTTLSSRLGWQKVAYIVGAFLTFAQEETFQPVNVSG
jgi:hypothetical protein